MKKPLAILVVSLVFGSALVQYSYAGGGSSAGGDGGLENSYNNETGHFLDNGSTLPCANFEVKATKTSFTCVAGDDGCTYQDALDACTSKSL